MIVTLKDTDTAKIGSRLVELREEGGVVALGRVLTLIIVADGIDVEAAVDAANEASREHPCRVLVVHPGDGRAKAGLDAEIRLGADAGASDVVVLKPRGEARRDYDTLVTPLLLPDAPVVVWWPHDPPEEAMAGSPLGAIAQRRISDVLSCANSVTSLEDLAGTYAPGDTDLSWARTTLWRGMAAAALDDPPYEAVTSAVVYGSKSHPSVHLLAGWLAFALKVPVTLKHEPGATAITGFDLVRKSGPIELRRPEGSVELTITRPDQPVQTIAMPMRSLADVLMEDLRRLDPDEVYEATLRKGLPKVEVS